MSVKTDPAAASSVTPAAQRARDLRAAAWRHRGSIVWFAVMLLLLSMAWPMIKGQYYRLSGTPPPDDHIPWRTDYAAALVEAKQTGKHVLIDFTAGWCPPCQTMKHEAWPDAAVREAVVKDYIPLLMDVDLATSQEPAQRYFVQTIPAIFIVDAEGNVKDGASFMNAGELLRFLTSTRASATAPADR